MNKPQDSFNTFSLFTKAPSITPMAPKSYNGLGLALLTITIMLCSRTAAQSSACTNVLITLSPCLNYISGNTSTPSSGCCSKLASVVSSQPQCLCEALSADSSSLGLNINRTLAMALPSACNVQTPPLSTCTAASPVNSPSGTPDSANPAPTERGLNTTPSTQSDGSSSDASSTKISISVLFVLLVATSYVASFTMH